MSATDHGDDVVLDRLADARYAAHQASHARNECDDCALCAAAAPEDRPHVFVLASAAGLASCALPGCARAFRDAYHAGANDGTTYLARSPNGVEHLVVNHHCATCGRGPHERWPRSPEPTT